MDEERLKKRFLAFMGKSKWCECPECNVNFTIFLSGALAHDQEVTAACETGSPDAVAQVYDEMELEIAEHFRRRPFTPEQSKASMN